jgi:hypothetical protein
LLLCTRTQVAAPTTTNVLAIGSVVVRTDLYKRAGASAHTSLGVVIGLCPDALARPLSQQRVHAASDRLKLLVVHPDGVKLSNGSVQPLSYVLVACATTLESDNSTDFFYTATEIGAFKVDVQDFRSGRWGVFSSSASFSASHAATLEHIRVEARAAGFLQQASPMETATSDAAMAAAMAVVGAAEASKAAEAAEHAAAVEHTVREFVATAMDVALDAAATAAALEQQQQQLQKQALEQQQQKQTLEQEEASAWMWPSPPDNSIDDFALALNNDDFGDGVVVVDVGRRPAAAEWQTVNLLWREAEMRRYALKAARHNPGLAKVLLLRGAFDNNDTIYTDKLPAAHDVISGPHPLGLNPIPGVATAKWNALDAFTISAFMRNAGVYPGDGVPFDATSPGYHTLSAHSSEGDLLGLITIKLAATTSILFPNVASATTPLICVSLLATKSSMREVGLGAALYETALCACFPQGKRLTEAYVFTEAVSKGSGWKWWRHRVYHKDPLAVILGIQLLIVDNVLNFSPGSLPCGRLLLPDEPPPATNANNESL